MISIRNKSLLFKVVNATLFAISLATLVYSLWFFISRIDMGPELSDTAFYILMRTEYVDILNMLTGFGVFLAALFGDADVQTVRLFTILALIVFPAFFMAVIYLDQPKHSLSFLLLAGAVTSSVSNLSYYNIFLLDASYNGVELAIANLCALSMWGIWGEFLPKRTWQKNVTCAWAFMLGACLFLLILIRIPTGILTAFIVLPVYFIALFSTEKLEAREWRAFSARILIFALLGAMAALMLISALTLPVNILWDRFLTGLEAATFLGSHSNSIFWQMSILAKNLGHLAKSVLENAIFLVVPLACIAVLQLNSTQDLKRVSLLLKAINLIVIITLVVANFQNFKVLAQIVWAFAITVSLLTLVEFRKKPKYVLFTFILVWMPYGLTFGSNNALIPHGLSYVGTVILSMVLAALTLKNLRYLLVTSVVIFGSGLTISAIHEANTHPYRYGSPLSEATIQFEVRGEKWRVPSTLAGTYKQMELIRQTTKWKHAHENVRPILLDMTGRAPGLNWLGDFRVPSVAWIFSGYKGSDMFLNWALGNLNEDDLKKMWIAIDNPSDKGVRTGLTIEVLNTRLSSVGREFPKDFERVGNAIPITYINRTAFIFAPKNMLNEQ